MASGEWFLVRAADPQKGPSNSEEKLVAAPTPSVGVMVHPALRRKGAKAGGLIRVTLWQKISQSQANTALLTGSALQPGSAYGMSSLAAEYDLARCLGVTVHAAASQGTQAVADSWTVAFDPILSGNGVSNVDGLSHRYHIGPTKVSCNASGTADNQFYTDSGFRTMHCKTAKTFVSGVSSDVIGSNWYASTSTSSVIGYLKPYVENSAAGTVYLTMYVGYDMEFKYRG
jgi:hypothetical protein